MKVRALQDGDAPLLARFIAEYPYKPYRHYRVWSRAKQQAMLEAEVARSQGTPGARAMAAGAGDAAAIALFRPLEWDTRFFGMPMGRVDYVLRGPDAGPETLAAAIEAAVAHARAGGVVHLTARTDVEDMHAVAALEGAGFRLMDALVTYFTHPRREPPTPVREVGRIRPLEPEDVDELLEITREAYADFHGRFHLDPHVPRERAQALYEEWARQCCAGQMADRVVVADNGHGGLLGWAATRRVEPASSIGGIGLWNGTLGACRRDAPGAYAGLIRSLAVANHAAGEVTETQTQNHNIATVRILDAVGAKYVRGEYTFHRWLGTASNDD